MTRTARYKALYLTIRIGVPLIILGVAILIHQVWRLPPLLPLVLVGLAIVLLRSGLIRRFLWRDLIAGQSLLKRKDYAGSKLRFERFIAGVRKAPWRKTLIWLGTASRSRDPEALALSSLAAAEISLGAFEAARNHLGESIALDPENPVPFHSMGIVCVLAGPWVDAKLWLEKAAALGFSSDWTQKIIEAAQSQFALADGAVSGDRMIDRSGSEAPDPPAATGECRVELLNDDVTPMEFVIETLERIFDQTGVEAVRIMLTVHHQGSAVCGRYDEAEARERVDKAVGRARALDFPLAFRVARDGQAASRA